MARWLGLALVAAVTALFVANPFSDEAERGGLVETAPRGLDALRTLPNVCEGEFRRPDYISATSVFAAQRQKTPQQAIESLLRATGKRGLSASGFGPAYGDSGGESGEYWLEVSGVIMAQVQVAPQGELWTANDLQICEQI